MHADDTFGDCPVCGHKEQGYDDWESLGYLSRKTAMKTMEQLAMRVFRCRTCGALFTPDTPK